MTNLETLRQQTADLEAKLKEMKAEIERLENVWEMKCPYRYDDEYFYINTCGDILSDRWCDFYGEKETFVSGNIFPTRETALLEAKRRKLLTRFRAFRDECNGDWKADFIGDNQYFLRDSDNGLHIDSVYFSDIFVLFGYFKNFEDAERAVELFGDEIKELFTECV